MCASLGCQTVGRRWQILGIALAVVLYLVDKFLRVFNAYAEGERFGLEQPSVGVKQRVNVAGRVACGQDYGCALDAVAVLVDYTFYTSILDNQVADTGVEVVFAAVFHDGAAHVGYDAAQPVGADVGVGIEHYVGVGTVGYEGAKHTAHVASLGGTGVELAVAIGAGATLSETPVAVGVDALFAGQGGNVVLALLHGFSAFHDDGTDAVFQQPQRCEEAGRAGTDDDDLFSG